MTKDHDGLRLNIRPVAVAGDVEKYRYRYYTG
jgi:hypothetical protein